MSYLRKIQVYSHTDEQKNIEAGKVIEGNIGDDHRMFIQKILELLQSGEIDPIKPSTFLHAEVYNALPEEEQDKLDLELQSIAAMIRVISNFQKQGATENSVHFHTTAEHLWDMVNRIEINNDVFKF
jgi:hypothetical protein